MADELIKCVRCSTFVSSEQVINQTGAILCDSCAGMKGPISYDALRRFKRATDSVATLLLIIAVGQGLTLLPALIQLIFHFNTDSYAGGSFIRGDLVGGIFLGGSLVTGTVKILLFLALRKFVLASSDMLGELVIGLNRDRL